MMENDNGQQVTEPHDPMNAERLESEQLRWAVDKFEFKRRLLEEVVGLLQHDRSASGAMSQIIQSASGVASRSPDEFWRNRSTPASAQAKFQLPFPPPPFPLFPGFPFLGGGSPTGSFDISSLIPQPGDVLGQILNHIEAEKKLIADLVGKLLD